MPAPRALRADPVRWSLLAGGYAALVAALLLLVLWPVAGTVTAVLEIPVGSPLLLGLPVPLWAPIAWWLLVERPGAYGYVRGGLAGLLTAVATVAVWVLLALALWGPPLVLWGYLLVGVTLAVVAPGGFVAGLPLLYLRRRFGAG